MSDQPGFGRAPHSASRPQRLKFVDLERVAGAGAGAKNTRPLGRRAVQFTQLSPRDSFLHHKHSRRVGAPPGCQARCPDLSERSPMESALITSSPPYRAGRLRSAWGRDSPEVPRRVGGSGIQTRGRGGGARCCPGAERRAGRKAKGVARRLAILSGRGESRAASPGKGAPEHPRRWGSARGGRGPGERSGAHGFAGTSS